MLRYFLYPFRYFVFWFLYFLVMQGAFLLFFFKETADAGSGHILYSFRAGFPMNLSAAAYQTFLYALLMVFALKRTTFPVRWTRVLTGILLGVNALIAATDLALYSNWGSRINGKALWYLQFPESVANSAASTSHISYWLFVLVISLAAWFVQYKWFKAPVVPRVKWYVSALLTLLVLGTLFVVLRGGFVKRPLNRGWSYYSRYPVLNYASVNGFWNFFDVVSHYKPQGNPYHFFTDAELKRLEGRLNLTRQTSSRPVTHTQRPNLVFVYLESWTADVVGCIGGEKGVTPGFDQLSKEGLLFTNFYSTGFRTEQGLMATLSGFPAQAQVYPMEEMERFENYPNLIRLLDSAGYYTSYFTGGNPSFANTDSYLLSAGIKKINRDLLDRAKRRSAWGALDEETFTWALNTISAQPRPFFSNVVTLTSHEWFEAPVAKYFTDKDPVAAAYRNTVHYTDSCLLDFVSRAKQTDWYANTLFVIMADHACSFPLGRQISQPERYHIPMVVLGGALDTAFRGKTADAYCGHLNLPAMICKALNLDPTSFGLSSDALEAPYPFAYYTYDHGFGVLSSKGKLVYDMNLGKPILNDLTDKAQYDLQLTYGKFMMQRSAGLKGEYQERR